MTMKAAILVKIGDPTTEEVLRVEENVDVPQPKKDEVLIKVRAAAINPVDWKIMRGDFPGKSSGTVGLDVSGVVEQIGPDTTTDLKVGDEIYADAIETGGGSFAEYVAVQTVAASRKPSNIGFAEAAALPLAGLTALQGLVTHGGFKSGQKVCILGGSGGVGSLAIQMAKAMGAAHVYATGSSVDMIKGFGADTVINYKEQSVVEELKGKELDLVYDTVGGVEGWEAAKGGLKKGGKFVTVVGDGGAINTIILGIMWRKTLAFFWLGPEYNIFLTNTKAPEVVNDMKKLTELVEAGKVKPVLDAKKFELTTKSVHDMIQVSMTHRAKGKLVLIVNP
jgi:NADPH:quinone reductase-like Zn-dependent oxidoreductase